jgi:hypothetical protein
MAAIPASDRSGLAAIRVPDLSVETEVLLPWRGAVDRRCAQALGAARIQVADGLDQFRGIGWHPRRGDAEAIRQQLNAEQLHAGRTPIGDPFIEDGGRQLESQLSPRRHRCVVPVSANASSTITDVLAKSNGASGTGAGRKAGKPIRRCGAHVLERCHEAFVADLLPRQAASTWGCSWRAWNGGSPSSELASASQRRIDVDRAMVWLASASSTSRRRSKVAVALGGCAAIGRGAR